MLGTLNQVKGEFGDRIVKSCSFLVLFANNETKRIRPSTWRLQAIQFLAVAAQDRYQATYVFPSLDLASPQDARDDQSDYDDGTDDVPHVAGEEARRLGHREFLPGRVVDLPGG